MVVDDDEAVRTVLETILCKEGHDVATAAGGAEALEWMRSGRPPDLVLLDLMMPGVSGWEVLEAMSESPRLVEIPVVVLTAFGDGAERPTGRALLHKPIDDELLRGLIGELLTQKEKLEFTLEEPPSDLLPRRTRSSARSPWGAGIASARPGR
jgi:CheY-like chemotaxis protein